ncbi:hypothetical protein [Rhodopirellula baltica]|uniref:Uncharacterized protein n=1 Tax=Rhodopirellula baltica SWK14 TaxID=993516 RepID=L7C9A4_RHOBT|nr:hypothetical protein [Rhodopirellula baltica]ELP29691.1 hypothetical protein RBSWK_06392 [Rhodopirellula baltica SWK14]
MQSDRNQVDSTNSGIADLVLDLGHKRAITESALPFQVEQQHDICIGD